MALTVEVDGTRYNQAISMSVKRSIENATGSFYLTTSSQEDNLIPVKRGSRIRIFADDQVVLTGFAETVAVQYSSTTHTISVSGRDVTADLVDSSVINALEFQGPIEFTSIIRSVLDSLNMQSVGIVNEAGTIEPFTEIDFVSADVGERAFDFLNRYASKRQVLLTTDGRGNLLIVRGRGSRLPVRLVYGKNILSAMAYYDDTGRFNRYTIQSQLNPLNLDSSVAPEAISDQNGEAVDSAIRNRRVSVMESSASMESSDCIRLANLESNLRRVNGFNYTVTVQGHSIPGFDGIWTTNRSVEVEDPLTDVNGTLLIKSCKWYYSLDSGSTTELVLTYIDAYTIQAEVDRLEAQINSFGGSF